MPRKVNLTAKAVAKITTPGRHAVGPGCYLSIDPDGGREWWARGTDQHGRRRWARIGDAAHMNLAEALQTAPTAVTQAAEAQAAPKGTRTFLEAANAFFEAHAPTWKNKAHAAQWRLSIFTYAKPLHYMKVDLITARDVAAILLPLQDRPETCVRARNRMEQIIDSELVGAGLITHPNPSTLKIQSHLVPALSKKSRKKARKAVEHHPALPLAEARALWHRIPNTVPGRALRLLMLTCLRTSEVRFAQWKHWNPETRVLTVPRENAKNGEVHTVPVPAAALPLLSNPRAPDAYVFSHARSGRHLSQDAMRMTLRRAGVASSDGAVHGFRSTFRDWCRDTGRDETLAELALGHTPGDDTVKAYARSNALERRRELMEDWSEALTAPDYAGNVTPIRGAR
jgi:integrase